MMLTPASESRAATDMVLAGGDLDRFLKGLDAAIGRAARRGLASIALEFSLPEDDQPHPAQLAKIVEMLGAEGYEVCTGERSRESAPAIVTVHIVSW